MRVLGVDPGTVICGYGIVEVGRVDGRERHRAVAYGVIRARTKEAQAMAARLLRVFRGLSQIIEAHRPDVLAIEEAFVWKNPRSALAIGQGRAAAIIAAAEHGLPVFEYQPTIVKKAVTGSGRAPKSQVQAMVTALLQLSALPEPTDAADALAVAFAHVHRAERPTLSRSAAPPRVAPRDR